MKMILTSEQLKEKIEADGECVVEAGAPRVSSLRAAVEGIADDYMTSEHHHPGYVLIPTAKFEEIRSALSRPVQEPVAVNPGMLRLAVAAVLEADKEFRAQMMPGWDGDPLADELDGLRRVFEAPQPTHGTSATDPAPAPNVEPFQARVQPWMMACFGAMIAGDREERNHRFLEEALELVQSTGCTAHEAHQLVDYVYGRDIGEPHQEVGGVMVTLAALCLANDLDMHQCGETELTRIWTKVEAIRAKQAAKPKHSPLPGPTACDLPDPSTRDCQNMKEVGGGMDGERYRCDVCGKGYFLDYEEMK